MWVLLRSNMRNKILITIRIIVTILNLKDCFCNLNHGIFFQLNYGIDRNEILLSGSHQQHPRVSTVMSNSPEELNSM